MSGDPAEEQVEEPDAGSSGEEHRDTHGPYAGVKTLENGAVDPGFKSPQVTHEHQREAGAAPRVRVGDDVRLEDAVGEEGFVVLNAQKGHEGAARDEKQQAGGQRGKAVIENSRDPNHLIYAQLIFLR